MELLNRDGIKIEDVCDYHIYPIADNDTPRLSSDRLEYTLSNGLGVRMNLFSLDDIREIYKDICILNNEEENIELGFKTKEIAEKFVHNMNVLSCSYVDNKTKLSMNFLADVMKKISEYKIITIEEMYTLSEKEVIEKIENSNKENIVKCFKEWKEQPKLIESQTPIENKYGGSIKGKLRYINPLVKTEKGIFRIKDISNQASEDIESVLNYNPPKYGYFDFKTKF